MMRKLTLIAILLITRNGFAMPTGISKPEDRSTAVGVMVLFGLASLAQGISMIRKKKFEADGLTAITSSIFWGRVYCLIGGAMLFFGLICGLSIWVKV